MPSRVRSADFCPPTGHSTMRAPSFRLVPGCGRQRRITESQTALPRALPAHGLTPRASKASSAARRGSRDRFRARGARQIQLLKKRSAGSYICADASGTEARSPGRQCR